MPAAASDALIVQRDESDLTLISTSSPNSSSASPTTTAQKRKAARDMVNERAPRKKPVRKKKNKSGSADKGQLSLDAVARKTRWMVLLHFSRKDYESVIKSVYGDDVSPESAEYNAARGQIFDQVRQYKSLTLATMKKHVQELIEVDKERDGNMYESQEVKTLHKFFSKLALAGDGENFLRVFNFIAGHIKIKGCTDLGKYYLTNIYANLAVQVKLHLDRVLGGKPGVKDSWDTVIAFYDKMATHSNYDLVDEDQFEKLTAKAAREKPAPERVHLAPDNDPMFLTTGPPPPPVIPDPPEDIAESLGD